jgi:hypothetical protein
MTVSGANAKLFFNAVKTGSGAVTVTAGTLGGTGSIAGDVTNNGRIAPGTSVGTLTMTGNVTMGANSSLAIELEGASADKLVVGGNLNLSDFDFLDVTGAGSGSSWTIATYGGTLTGIFDSVTSGYTVNYGTGTNSQITLNVDIVGVPGDYNGNGVVDGADYVVWRKNNGTAFQLQNEVSDVTPGQVTAEDYDAWRERFGNTSGAGSSPVLSAVPEPASALLIVLGIAGMQVAHARRRIRAL